MPKRSRGIVGDDSDSDESFHSPKHEENGAFEGDIRDDTPADADEEEAEGMSWPVVLRTNSVSSKRGRGRPPKRTKVGNDSDDDEYADSEDEQDIVNEDSESESSEFQYEYDDEGFVVDSDGNADDKGYRNQHHRRRDRTSHVKEENSGPKRPRGRPRKEDSVAERRQRRAIARNQRKSAISDEEDDELNDESDAFSASEGSIAEELRELRGNQSPARRGRNYRVRAPVNYMIPPPPTVEEVARAKAREAETAAATKGRDPRARRLFDVRGPFGGRDVHTIFNTTMAELQQVIKRSKRCIIVPEVPGLGVNGSMVSNKTAGDRDNDNADIDPIDVTDVDFSMVGGLDNCIAKLKEMVSLPLLYPELYEKFGISPPRGVLFHGPPGTGKTLMARALAASHRQEKVTFYMRKGADVLSKWIGESERQLRALFDEARAHQPSIIFFDEIDGLAPVRSAKQEQHHASIVSTLLALMDGLDNRGQVVVIGATNRPDSVDPALRRPGRFDHEFYFPLPDHDARLKILEIHTRKWQPKLSSKFLNSIASQTKGYGGADLRALTTEAALLAINRAYPQIYTSEARLTVNPDTIEVRPQDFALALERVQPSTARVAGVSLAQPLPHHVEPLLRDTFAKVSNRVRVVFPATSAKESQMAALYLNDQQFSQARGVSLFQKGRVHRPRLLLRGAAGNGQRYIIRAVSNMLEGVYTRELDTSAILGAGAIQPEAALVGAIAEVRQRAPSCLLLSSLSAWSQIPHLAALLGGLLKSLGPNEQVLVVASDEIEHDSAEAHSIAPLLEFFDNEAVTVQLDTRTEVISQFFEPVRSFIKRNPLQCLEAQEIPRSDPPKLAEAPVPKDKEPTATKQALEAESTGVFTDTERRELRIRSQLKLRLGLILDGFRQKYRRFRKPVVDELKLVHLFETPSEPAVPGLSAALVEEKVEAASEADGDVESVEAAEIVELQEPYIRTADNMILERRTGKKYHNMDLETVEDRLWNGFYCEPAQFLGDIEMIYKDSVEHGERERMHKASEMLANAQVAIDDISIDRQFIERCQIVRAKDAETRLKELEEEDAAKEVGGIEVDSPVVVPSVDVPAVDAAAMGSVRALVETENVLAKDAAMEALAPPVRSGASQEEYDRDLRKSVELDTTKYDSLTSDLLAGSKNLSLDELEQLFAALSDIAWQFKSDWNRNAMVDAMLAHVKSVSQL